MSSILKSLRKVEKEKRTDQQAVTDLMVDQGLAPTRSRSFLPLLAGFVLGALVVGGWGLWSSREAEPVATAQPVSRTDDVATPAKPTQGHSSAIPTERLTDAGANSDPAQKTDPAGQNVAALAEAGRVSVVTLQPQPVKAAVSRQAATPKPAAAPPLDKAPPSKTATIVKNPVKTIQAPQKTVAVNSTPNKAAELPDDVFLLVSEIFYQDDSANSMAVVNDLPVMVGTQVDAAVVTEIRPDSVIFELDGISYDVALVNP